MIKGIGKVDQIGYIVRDIDKALDYWINVLGVGPWFVREASPQNIMYRGKAMELKMKTAFANSGSLQIELIQDITDGPTFYREALHFGHEGIHHIAFWQEIDKYDETCKIFAGAGFKEVFSGESDGPTGRFAYYENTGCPGTLIEISSLGEVKAARWKKIREAAAEWDGSAPIRFD